METLALHNDATIVHWEYNTRCISVVVAKIFTSLELTHGNYCLFFTRTILQCYFCYKI